MKKAAWGGLFVVVLAGALLLRTRELGLRPMHHDEANQALKFGTLLETGEYRYDKDDHHGPSLYYLTLPVARAAGRRLTASLDETVLRLVPALFGAGALLLFLLLRDGLGRGAVLFCGLFAAISPLMVYYARFYIQETILVFFIAGLLASLWRYSRRPSSGWAAAAGFCAGMMYATKETSIIAFAAAAAAFLFASTSRGSGRSVAGDTGSPRPRAWHGLLGLAVALAAAGLLFTSFLRNPGGLWDSVLSFRVYFARGAEAGWHAQPPSYYLEMLAFSKFGASAPAWSEALVLLLAAVGSVAALRKSKEGARCPSLPRIVFVYTIVSCAAYSLIPYKTPWNALPFYLGVILLAGHGAASLMESCPKTWTRILLAALLLAGTFHLWLQCRRANFVLYADPRNPYVYAQTGTDFLRLVRRVEGLAAVRPEGKRMLIKVFAGPYDTWPLPWYLRGYTNVGYWPDAASAGAVGDAPVVVASADQARAVGDLLGSGYHSEFYGLRPEVLLSLFVRNDLWGRYLSGKAGT
ncbi:MAG TPA: flippase activity-associated protein Agl23 [Acidobacteriota bacterium]|nr:flippase activity-associated protein Agl23 [Acidobacteriota bacterium]